MRCCYDSTEARTCEPHESPLILFVLAASKATQGTNSGLTKVELLLKVKSAKREELKWCYSHFTWDECWVLVGDTYLCGECLA
ncbi:hypothetical protein E2C01_053959 [Portunus trituberculatus]|uniref:Uncharacterized protein n=1 Tax=Portunus trituberculatus TaxID=210409 RepID=A0A5B7GRW0_PORTR|nr:hypothetical protein [Portunus trituberculatus]